VTTLEHPSNGGHIRPCFGHTPKVSERALACEAIYYALFRVVEVSEYEDAEAAVEWAQKALEWQQLREGLVDRVEEMRAERLQRAASAG
jgi:hypothetical protein